MTAGFEWGEPISVYTKAQAVEDGQQVAVPQDILDMLDVRAQVYLTSNLYFGHIVAGDDDAATHHNLWTLVRAASVAFRAGDTSDMMRTNIVIDGVTVWGVIDGDGVTLMLPEDY